MGSTSHYNMLGREYLASIEFPMDCLHMNYDSISSSVLRFCDSPKCKGEKRPAADYWVARQEDCSTPRCRRGCLLSLYCMAGSIPRVIKAHEFYPGSNITFSNAKVIVCLHCGEVSISHD